jgi:hypothetical protein
MQLDLYEEVFELVGCAPGYTVTADGRIYGPSGRRLSVYRHQEVTVRRRGGLKPGRSAFSIRAGIERSVAVGGQYG